MDRVLLRKLAWKSVLDFGKYQGQSVKQVFDLHHKRILRWYYYNLSKISFIPEILRAIGIEERDEITKPGIDPEKGKKIDEIMDMREKRFCKKAFLEDDKGAQRKICCNKARRRKTENAKAVRAKISDRKEFSKARMQWKNQGHDMGGD